jgi:V/A-type H+-transporting ATPase subunit E
MADELQHLIDRLQKEAVEAGEKQAGQIVAHAKERAAALVREAEEKARGVLEKAEQDAKVFTERGRQTLGQAARDLLIAVGQGVQNIVGDLAGEAADEALTADTVREMLVKMAEAYAARGGRNRRIEILLGPEDQAKLLRFFQERYADELRRGLAIHIDNEIVKGFKVSFVEDHVYHDFTREAVAEALAAYLRPHLAEIVTRAAREKQGAPGGAP